MRIEVKIFDDNDEVFTEFEHYSTESISKMLVNAEIQYRTIHPEPFNIEQYQGFKEAFLTPQKEILA